MKPTLGNILKLFQKKSLKCFGISYKIWDMRCKDKTSKLKRTLSSAFYAFSIKIPFRINHISVAFSKHLKIFWRLFYLVRNLTCSIQQAFLAFQNVFSVTISHLSRCLQTSSRRLRKMSLRRIQDVSSRGLQDVFKTCLQDVFKMSSTRRLKNTSWRCLGRQKNVRLKTSSAHLQHVLNTSSPRKMFVRILLYFPKVLLK